MKNLFFASLFICLGLMFSGFSTALEPAPPEKVVVDDDIGFVAETVIPFQSIYLVDQAGNCETTSEFSKAEPVKIMTIVKSELISNKLLQVPWQVCYERANTISKKNSTSLGHLTYNLVNYHSLYGLASNCI